MRIKEQETRLTLQEHDDDDDDNILGGNVHTVKENAEALLVSSKEIG